MRLLLLAAGVALGLLAGRYRLVRRAELEPGGWHPGSDRQMAADVLARARHDGELADQERDRKRARRAE